MYETNRRQPIAGFGPTFRMIWRAILLWLVVASATCHMQAMTRPKGCGVPSTVPPQTLNSFFHPQAGCLELGVTLVAAPEQEFLQPGTSPTIQTVWKLYGPDANGVYGGLNGTGGLEGVSPYLNTFNLAISDARGNVLGEDTNGVVSWTLARPTAYGSVPGFRPVAFGNGVDLLQSSVWGGHEVDVTGYHNYWQRPYDSISGQWLCGDPLGYTERDPNGYSLCGGDPVNYTDADGLIGKAALQMTENYAQGFNGFVKNTYFSMSYGLTAVTYGQNQANQWYGQNWQRLKQTVTGTAQTVYDTAAFASFELLSPIAPQQSAQSYGPSIDRLYGLDTAFTGGEANSAAYRTTATIANAGLFVLGGRLWPAGIAGRTEAITTAATMPNGSFYSVAYQTILNSTDLGKSREVHFNRANAALDKAIQSDPEFAVQMEHLIPGVSDSVSKVGGRETPEGWVWHHDQGIGVMQLVPENQHTPGSIFWNTLHPTPGNAGGYSIWAIPAGAPRN